MEELFKYPESSIDGMVEQRCGHESEAVEAKYTNSPLMV